MKKKIQKPFDVEAAKNGAMVETRDGMSVRIICYDRADCIYPIVALVNNDGHDTCNGYTSDGKLFCSGPGEYDLVIVEEVEETKFNVGDWVVRDTVGEHPLLITAITPNYYSVQDSQSIRKVYLARITVDTYFRLWTLDDARPGDVLVCKNNNNPFIFKGCIDEAHPGYPTAYCGINCSGEFISNAGQTWWTNSSVRPATYKEKQQFFNRLEEEGYKWDAESLTLSKIQKRWRDNEKADINGYYIDGDSSIILAHSGYNSSLNHNVFVAVKQAKAALAMARISQIMDNDKRFGGTIADEEWVHHENWVILRNNNTLIITSRYAYEYLAFHTKEQAELFLEENEDLVKDYYMLD